MKKTYFIIKNTMGGSICNKCLNWSNMPDGLEGEECLATKEEETENRKRVKAHRIYQLT